MGGMPERPWEPGDELMMRMGPIPLPGVRNLTAEANSAGEAVLRWEVAYRAGVSGYRIWRHRPGIDEGPRIYVSNTLSTDTTYTDANSPVPTLTEYQGAGDRQELQRRGEFRVCTGRRAVGGTCESQDLGAGGDLGGGAPIKSTAVRCIKMQPEFAANLTFRRPTALQHPLSPAPL